MNNTPSSGRVHIAFFGRRNAGKSSLVNAVTGQNLAIVSEIKGTTTDPVYKAMELLPLGPVVIIDTPGYDDDGQLGELRVEKTRQVLNKTDMAVLVLDGELPPDIALSTPEAELIDMFKARSIPYLLAHNKSDVFLDNKALKAQRKCFENCTKSQCSPCPKWVEKASFPIEIIPVSTKTGVNINLLKEKIAELAYKDKQEQPLVRDLIKPDDFIICVIPIDKAAPKGRLILPQQQVIRDVLEAGAAAITVRETELRQALASVGKKPSLVITDSQAFEEVSAIVPQDIPLTSFSILFARYKGFLDSALEGISALDTIDDGGKILICEGCTHHRQCDDIGTVKLPKWIRAYTGKEPDFSYSSGGDFPSDLSPYKLVIHCGACMLNEREMHYRRNHAASQSIPFTNYGIAIAHMKGILQRSIAVVKEDIK
jgi:[FeFe] hydrogenase H-cluster maturation GTPase HydF